MLAPFSSLLLTGSFSYSSLKTLYSLKLFRQSSSNQYKFQYSSPSQAKTATVTNLLYDEHLPINLTETTVNETQVYVADVTVSSSEYLKTAFAQNYLEMNVTALKHLATVAEMMQF